MTGEENHSDEPFLRGDQARDVDQREQGTLDELRVRPDSAAALRYFDSLPPVTVEEMLGPWRGSGLNTQHPLDGLLECFRWYGKRFDTPEDVHPLIFTGRDGHFLSINPSRVPWGLLLRRPRLARLARLPVVGHLFAVARSLLATTKPQARLRMTQYRGVLSATMCYDSLPIHDIFRKIDENAVMGAMDMRGAPQPFLFLLTRVGPGDAPG